MKTIRLNENAQIPILGFGTWQIKGADCTDAVKTALDVGYRHIDTADRYENHQSVGAGIKESGIAREDIFLTTKVWMDMLEPDAVRSDVSRFLDELQTDYIDLLLIHWPNREVPIADTIGVMEELKGAGSLRAIGVSNFTEHHLEDALATGHEVAVNQVEVHPGFPQHALRAFCKEHGIAVTAYSPLGRGEVLDMPLMKELAEKYEVGPGVIAINWILSRGMIAIPKAASTKHIENNFKALDFEMDVGDLDLIDQLHETGRVMDPSFADFDY